MKVSELISALYDYPSDLDVLMSSDEDGNSIVRVDEVDGPYRTWQHGYDFVVEPDAECGTAVVIWPVA